MPSTSEAFVWVWLPGSSEPVPAGLAGHGPTDFGSVMGVGISAGTMQ